MLGIPETLNDIRSDITTRLTRAAADRKSAMHAPVVATADADIRVMVLRAYDPAKQMLRFHTDKRSPKAALIGNSAPVGVLFYDKGAKVQIRCRGAGRIESSGPIADAAWADGSNFAKRCYLGEGPGVVSPEPTSGLPLEMEGVQPTDEQVVPARENFAVLLIEVTAFDWLYLANSGHMRAQFDGDTARWVAP